MTRGRVTRFVAWDKRAIGYGYGTGEYASVKALTIGGLSHRNSDYALK